MARNNKMLMELFETAHKDKMLRERLLENPEAVAKEFNVEINKKEVQKLKELGAFVKQATEFKMGNLFPPEEPIDFAIRVWLDEEVEALVYKFIIRPEVYPAPFPFAVARWLRYGRYREMGRARAEALEQHMHN